MTKGVPGVRTVTSGHSGSDVLGFQRIMDLHQITVGCDGALGPRTKAVVESFRRKYGITASGSVDAATRAASWR